MVISVDVWAKDTTSEPRRCDVESPAKPFLNGRDRTEAPYYFWLILLHEVINPYLGYDSFTNTFLGSEINFECPQDFLRQNVLSSGLKRSPQGNCNAPYTRGKYYTSGASSHCLNPSSSSQSFTILVRLIYYAGSLMSEYRSSLYDLTLGPRRL